MRKRKSLFQTLPETDPNLLHAIVHSQFTDELWHAPPLTKRPSCPDDLQQA
jgi:hypothetical protein